MARNATRIVIAVVAATAVIVIAAGVYTASVRERVARLEGRTVELIQIVCDPHAKPVHVLRCQRLDRDAR